MTVHERKERNLEELKLKLTKLLNQMQLEKIFQWNIKHCYIFIVTLLLI